MSRLQGYYQYPFIFMTACKWAFPMSQAKFELFEQSLDNLFNWLENKDVSRGHFVSKNQINPELLTTLKRSLGYQLTPVIVANSLDLIIDIYPTVAVGAAKTGILHVGRYNWLNLRDQNKQQDILGSLQKCFPEIDVLSLGKLDHEKLPTVPSTDMREVSPLIPLDGVDEFINTHEQIILTFDLSSLSKGVGLLEEKALDKEVKELIERCTATDKVRMILLTGDSDRSLYSRKTKAIYDGLKDVSHRQLQHA
ncbi:hypothetical protein [Vibrio viridaestus]|uniref:Uncharacterized protein n=1 Tax=Vibrio viridaestus TaxID=2487322 RepID=A0A3N9TKX3_9VIBR|nr:hypothetical protein [Vibrio viridaestus]RQW64930.1 hypothetical protein EES38_02520 [Vibrio viridaestus]